MRIINREMSMDRIEAQDILIMEDHDPNETQD